MDQKHNKANSPHQQIGSKMKIWSDWTPFISGIYQEPRVGKQLLFGPSFMVGCFQLLVCPAPLTIRILTPLGWPQRLEAWYVMVDLLTLKMCTGTLWHPYRQQFLGSFWAPTGALYFIMCHYREKDSTQASHALDSKFIEENLFHKFYSFHMSPTSLNEDGRKVRDLCNVKLNLWKMQWHPFWHLFQMILRTITKFHRESRPLKW